MFRNISKTSLSFTSMAGRKFISLSSRVSYYRALRRRKKHIPRGSLRLSIFPRGKLCGLRRRVYIRNSTCVLYVSSLLRARARGRGNARPAGYQRSLCTYINPAFVHVYFTSKRCVEAAEIQREFFKRDRKHDGFGGSWSNILGQYRE